MTNKTKRLTESAMLIAISFVLELVSKMLIPPLPFGGQVTLAMMLPVILISYRHGVAWGLLSGAAYSLLQMAAGAGNVTAAFQPGYFGDGRMIANAILMCALDYVLAYTSLGLGGVFRRRLDPRRALCAGTALAIAVRYLCHVASGYILFSGWAEWFFTQEGFPAWGAALVSSLNPAALGLAYSAVYNGMFMLPELVLTTLAAALISKNSTICRKVS